MNFLLGCLSLGMALAGCLPGEIPGTSCDQQECLKRVRNCTAPYCDVVCAVAPRGVVETWACVLKQWQRQGDAMECANLKPCPPFRAVEPSRCKGPVTLGYVVNSELTGCVRVRGCPLDSKLYTAGELFKEEKGCITRLRVCQKQSNSTTVNVTSTNSTTANVTNAGVNVTLTNVSTSNASVASNSTGVNVTTNSTADVTSNSSSSTENPTTTTNSSGTRPPSIKRNATRAVNGTRQANATPTTGPTGEGKVTVEWPLPSGIVLPKVSQGAAEIVAKTLSAPVVRPLQPLILGPWGVPGLDVDLVQRELKLLNPLFTIVKTNEFTPFLGSSSNDRFARLLYDDRHLLVSILRQ